MTRGVALAVAVSLATGCMTAATRARAKHTPASHAIVGGLIGDVAIGAISSRVHGRLNNDEGDTTPHYWAYIGGLLLFDVALLTTLYYVKKRGAAPAPSAAPRP